MENVKRTRFIGVYTLILCCFLALLSNNVQAELDDMYISSRCETSDAYVGEASSITCHFSKDLQQHNRTFRMYRSGFTDTKQEIILECYRPAAFGQLDCKPLPPGFEFDYKVSDKVTVTIPYTSLELLGKYECRAEPSYPHMIKDCTLMVKSNPVSHSTLSSLLITQGELADGGHFFSGSTTQDKGVDVAALAIGLIITVIALLFVGLFLYFFRQRIMSWFPCCSNKKRGHMNIEAGEKAHDEHAAYAHLSETSVPLLQSPVDTDLLRDNSFTCESKEYLKKDPNADLNNSKRNANRSADTENSEVQKNANSSMTISGAVASKDYRDQHNDDRNYHDQSHGSKGLNRPGPASKNTDETRGTHGHLSVTKGELPSVWSESDTEKQVCGQTDNAANQQGQTLTINDQTITSYQAHTEEETTASSQGQNSSSPSETTPSVDDTGRNQTADCSSSVQRQSIVEKETVDDGWIPVEIEDCEDNSSEISPDDGAAQETENTSVDRKCEQGDGPKQNLLFYQNKVRCLPDEEFIDEIHSRWKDDFDLLERRHGYIQWLFPNHQDPVRNPRAQKLYPHEAEAIQADKEAFDRVTKSYEMMLSFFGLRLVSRETGEVARAPNWEDRFANLQRNKHNNLRITRILLSLGEMGLERYKAPLVRHFLQEACGEKLRGTLESCRNFWIESIFSETEKAELRELYENAMKVNGGSWFSRLFRN